MTDGEPGGRPAVTCAASGEAGGAGGRCS